MSESHDPQAEVRKDAETVESPIKARMIDPDDSRLFRELLRGARASSDETELQRIRRIGYIAALGEQFAQRRKEADDAVRKDQAQQLLSLAAVIYPCVWELRPVEASEEED